MTPAWTVSQINLYSKELSIELLSEKRPVYQAIKVEKLWTIT
jgi:hypothetical protein